MDKLTYQYWRDNVCDERLEYLDSDEKYEMYLEWKEKEEEKKEDFER